jgi:phage tail-like protein
MATILNNRSNIATDPIRNFRFLVTFVPQGNTSIKTSGTATKGVTTVTETITTDGTANSWSTALAAIPFGFTSVSGLAVSTDSIPYREGGYNTTVHQIPGQTSFAPITLQRGVILGSSQNWNWMRELFQTVQGAVTRTTADNFRCDIEIAVLSHPIASTATGNVTGTAQTPGDYGYGTLEDDHVSMRFKVYNAWITSLAYSDLNAGDNAILVEQMTLVHEGFDVIFGANLDNTGSAGSFKY